VALGDPYVTLADQKHYMGIDPTNTAEDIKLTNALSATTAGINGICGRQFNRAGSVSDRVYIPRTTTKVDVDDFHTTVGLVVATDEDGDGVYETVWSSSDYQLEPLNGIVEGEPGWPFYRIRAVGTRRFPCMSDRATVKVSSDWGWAAVPEPVKTACRIVSEETWKLKDAPFGVAGVADFGVMRVRDNPMAMARLAKYQRDPVRMR
jgi:hypothetical protein